MKKRIIIVSHSMGLGGIERSLLGILNSIDYSLYSVDLFLMRHEGELLPLIPEQVNLLPTIPQCTCYAVPLMDAFKRGHILMCLGRIFAKLKAKCFKLRNGNSKKFSSVELEYSHKFTMPFIKKINNLDSEYDLAVSFSTPHYFVKDKVYAKKKIAWIHTDYSTIQVDRKSEFKMWNAFDYIAGVSDASVAAFINTFPRLEFKTIVIENILLEEIVRSEAKNISHDLFDSSFINILSVGRFDVAKNFESIPEIVNSLIKKGLKLRWYLIGFGQTEKAIRQNIENYGVQDYVILLGKKTNPYPYMKQCDVYVQPSKFEGKCVAVREAQILCKPVIITNYLTASSQVDSGVNGFIINQGVENIVRELFNLLEDSEKLNSVAKSCEKFDFGNKYEINKLYRIMEEK